MSASTTSGSNWVPAFRSSSAIACSLVTASQYGRSEVIASYASQAVITRAASGIASAARPSG